MIEVDYTIKGKLAEVIQKLKTIQLEFVGGKLERYSIDDLLKVETTLAGVYFYLSTIEAKTGVEKTRTYAWRKITQAGYFKEFSKSRKRVD